MQDLALPPAAPVGMAAFFTKEVTMVERGMLRWGLTSLTAALLPVAAVGDQWDAFVLDSSYRVVCHSQTRGVAAADLDTAPVPCDSILFGCHWLGVSQYLADVRCFATFVPPVEPGELMLWANCETPRSAVRLPIEGMPPGRMSLDASRCMSVTPPSGASLLLTSVDTLRFSKYLLPTLPSAEEMQGCSQALRAYGAGGSGILMELPVVYFAGRASSATPADSSYFAGGIRYLAMIFTPSAGAAIRSEHYERRGPAATVGAPYFFGIDGRRIRGGGAGLWIRGEAAIAGAGERRAAAVVLLTQGHGGAPGSR